MKYIRKLLNNRTPKKIKLINTEKFVVIASFDFCKILNELRKEISDVSKKSTKHLSVIEIMYDCDKKQTYLYYLNRYGVRYNRITFIEAVLIIASLLFNKKEYDRWDYRLILEAISEAIHIFAEKVNVDKQELLEDTIDKIDKYKIKDFRNIKYKKKINPTRDRIGIETENNIALNYLYFKDNSKPLIADIISILKIVSQDYTANQICQWIIGSTVLSYNEKLSLLSMLNNISFFHKPFFDKLTIISKKLLGY